MNDIIRNTSLKSLSLSAMMLKQFRFHYSSS